MESALAAAASATVGNTEVPPFVPHPLLRGGHLQTVVGRYLNTTPKPFPSTPYEVTLDDGDRLSVLESAPAGWVEGKPSALLVHGLAGSADAPYVVRLASRLYHLGVRVVRMNLRGAGSGFGLARRVYHAGRSEDLRAVAEWSAARTGSSPLALVGYSLGASLVLKLAAEAAGEPVSGLDCVLAANPPIDLAACSHAIRQPGNRIYDRVFVRQLRAEVRRLQAMFPDLEPIDIRPVRTLYDFDDTYTAPRGGFASAFDYYTKSSVLTRLPSIRIPGLVVHSEDDPFIPAALFRSVTFPPELALELISSGGHLGYFSARPWKGDRHWLDGRLVAWLTGRWGLGRAELVKLRPCPESGS